MMKGKHVTLRAVEQPDLEILRVMRNEHLADNIFRQYRPLTSKDQEGYWDRVINHENFVVFVITIPSTEERERFTVSSAGGLTAYFKKLEDRVIGEVRVGYINWRNRWAELGIFLGKEYRGKGYGRDALWLMMDYAFVNLGMHCIRAETVTPRVADIFREFGFVDVGKTFGTTWFDGKYLPDYMLDLYDDHWFAKKDEIHAKAVYPHVEPPPATF